METVKKTEAKKPEVSKEKKYLDLLIEKYAKGEVKIIFNILDKKDRELLDYLEDSAEKFKKQKTSEEIIIEIIKGIL